MKKFLSLLAVTMLVLFVPVMLAGCGTPDEAAESAWEMTVKSPDGEKIYPIEDILEMPAINLEAEKKGETHQYEGVLLSTILEEAGITDAAEVVLEADDGYTATISGEVAFSGNTIIAYTEDGSELGEKSAPLMLVTTDESPKVWVGQLSLITAK